MRSEFPAGVRVSVGNRQRGVAPPPPAIDPHRYFRCHCARATWMQAALMPSSIRPDGAIKGKDYAGTWTSWTTPCALPIPTPRTMLERGRDRGDQVRWLKDGKSLGTGTIVKGNANGF